MYCLAWVLSALDNVVSHKNRHAGDHRCVEWDSWMRQESNPKEIQKKTKTMLSHTLLSLLSSIRKGSRHHSST